MRRIWNYLREVAWWNVLAVALLLAGVVLAVFAVSSAALAPLAVSLGLGGIGLAIVVRR